MPVATEVSPPKPVQWKMPPASLGDEVLFYADLADKNGSPGIVTKLANRTISILDIRSRAEYTGIRHRDDPDVFGNIDLVRSTGGIWGESEKMRRLREMEEAIRDIATQVGECNRIANEALQAVRKRQS